MEELDAQLQQRVWARVYTPQRQLTSGQQQNARQCQQHMEEILRLLKPLHNHPTYRDAISHIEAQTRQHRQMLQQIRQR